MNNSQSASKLRSQPFAPRRLNVDDQCPESVCTRSTHVTKKARNNYQAASKLRSQPFAPYRLNVNDQCPESAKAPQSNISDANWESFFQKLNPSVNPCSITHLLTSFMRYEAMEDIEKVQTEPLNLPSPFELDASFFKQPDNRQSSEELLQRIIRFFQNELDCSAQSTKSSSASDN